ncbi:sigma-70 family RNA polymerase sigma factor [Chitinophaga sp. MM2321]|uniref:RNA polymerase sigma factor n=1 Tax=Chitinophaga sp. MM2321 TaxID=3137178 RepID=UPI0032D56C1A
MQHDIVHNEKELLKLLAKDSEYAFAVIFDHYRKKVLGTAIKMLKDHAMAEEIVQDIFMKVWLKRKEMETVTSLNSFIATMTRNLIFDRFRKLVNEVEYRKKINGAELVIDDTDHRVRTSQTYKILQNAIDTLPPRQKQVYEMVRIQGLSIAEISQSLSISKSTTKGHLTAALQAIRQYLNAHSDTFAGLITIQVLAAVFQ